MANVDVPGLNLDWLNLDTEQGVSATPGRKGLTLEGINTLSYAADGLAEAEHARQFSIRGAAADDRSPSHARQ